MAKVSIDRCGSYNKGEVRDALHLVLGKIDAGTSFKGKRVLVKPNLLGAFPPSEAVTTHPVIVEAVVECIRDNGGSPVVGDSPGGSPLNAEKVFQVTGMLDMAERTGVELINLGNSGTAWININSKFFRKICIAKPVMEVDCIISLPKFKTHELTTFTGAVKNIFGVVPGNLKSDFHRKAQRPLELSETMVDLFAAVKPQLSIMDAVVGMEGDGPSAGTPRKIGYIMASNDAVALDAVCVEMMGLRWDSVDTVRIAAKKGLGEGDISNIEILGPVLGELRLKDFILPQATYIERALYNWSYSISTYDWLKPRVEEKECTGCATCYQTCPVDAIEMADSIPSFDYEKCIRCYCCQELCPEHAIELKVDMSKKVILKAARGIAKVSRLTRKAVKG